MKRIFKKIAKFEDSRISWLILAVFMGFLVVLAHNFFQNYLYMPPCEKCVYIRFSMIVIAFGSLIASINPKNLALKFTGYIFGFYGVIYGIINSIKLIKIHAIVRSDDIFGFSGCLVEPDFPFSLPLANLYPSMFKPTGDCGFDNPIIPHNANLDQIQIFFTNLYSDGWYLIPSLYFGNMAQCTLLVYVFVLFVLASMFLSFILKRVK